MIGSYFEKFFRWIKGLWVDPQVYKAVVTSDIPKEVKEHQVFLVGDHGKFWVAVMKCPCGCGGSLHMNLIRSQRPCWRITVKEGGVVSFHPSLWKKNGCKSHFFLKDGVINWVK
tara:strand:+ start:586 stop:927 length:342 start_codon:yes stop_codon:yes gene_type:complete